jgi:predicted nucleotidyltransferase
LSAPAAPPFINQDFRPNADAAETNGFRSPQNMAENFIRLHYNYSANLFLTELCYKPRMKPSDALAAHRSELRQLVSRHGLARARVFGSVATGTDTEQSDLDLLVDPVETTSLLTLAAFKRDAENLLGVPVSVLTPNALPPKFRSRVLQQAEPL